MINLEIHSPVTPVQGFGLEQRSVTLHVKRDDLIHVFISGNKWRKLKHPLQEARALGRTRLVTFGGAWSNHLLATACAGATFGFSTMGFVRGEEEVSNPVLSLCRLFGMDLHYVARDAYREKSALYEAYVDPSDRSNDYILDEGGYGELAAKGCSELIAELSEAPYTHLFAACGTGTTLAGLANGLSQAGASTRLHGVPVLKNVDYLQDEIHRLAPNADFEWHPDYHFGGYAKSEPRLDEFIARFCANTGILVDPIYTGKLFYAIFDLLDKGAFAPGDRVLALHSGGLTGMLGRLDRY